MTSESDRTQPRPPRERRPIPNGSPADMHPAELAEGRIRLDVMREHHLDLSKRFIGEELYETDWIFISVMARSYGLVAGFIDAFDAWNPVVMAPLLRLQIDSLVRLSYLTKVPKVEDVALHLIGGGEFRDLKDVNGDRLSDRRLIEHAGELHPWIDDVYKATSGWVHFSPAHIRAAIQVTPDDSSGSLNVAGGIPIRPEQIPISALEELLGAMMQATGDLFRYVQGWEATKKAKLEGRSRTDRSK
jgi:hypothetical protein